MSVLGAIGETGLGQILVRRLTTPGAAVAPGVAPELFPNLVLENDRPEWGYLKQELRFGAYVSVGGAGAGNYARIYLRNPPESKLLAVLESFSPGAGTSFIVAVFLPDGVTTPVLGGQSRGNPLDSRMRRGQQSACIIESGSDSTANPSAGAVTVHYQLTTAFFTQPIVIAPGGAVEFLQQFDNTGVNVSLQWRERRAEPGELV